MTSAVDGTHFCRLDLDENSFYLLTNLKKNGTELALSLSDTESAWKGNLSKADLAAQCKRAKIECKEFMEQTVKALTQKNMREHSFQYQIDRKKDGNVTLHWKKIMSSDDIKVHLGDVTLKKQTNPSEILRTCFDHLLDSASKQSHCVHNLQVENERLSAERNTAVKRLEKCVEAKEKLEEDLLSKFVEVLNAKKAKLRSLQREEVDDNETDVPSTSKHSLIQSAPKKKESEPETEEKSLESDYDTDEDVPTKKPISIKALNLSSADSMILGSDPEEIPLAAVKRRKAPGRKPVASKPVVPRVSSGDKTSTSLSKPRNIRKSTSSNRSLEEIDADDLFDDME
ncbi:hypothetical protein CAPTEDRAFT_224052 [Capitella teleta]|uniref:DNA repair protein XRCC4 n=1 Tax=Capitella teleta TaxID=283909 RepID=R7V2P7_CAPTE|nr:hypothetical protein CAPTEDRAFT_224052 [Capitella teleta]|eukprot:ELU10601.1 hypothetical protein CAPTEDRAFT_224052 [Capitella teleta]